MSRKTPSNSLLLGSVLELAAEVGQGLRGLVHEGVGLGTRGEGVGPGAEGLDADRIDGIDVALDHEPVRARVDATQGDDLATVLACRAAGNLDAPEIDGWLGEHQAFLTAWTIAVRS